MGEHDEMCASDGVKYRKTCHEVRKTSTTTHRISDENIFTKPAVVRSISRVSIKLLPVQTHCSLWYRTAGEVLAKRHTELVAAVS